MVTTSSWVCAIPQQTWTDFVGLCRADVVLLRGDWRILWTGLDHAAGAQLHNLALTADRHMDLLLEEYQGIFREPTGLPPRWDISHRIRLHAGAEAVAVRPYRYAHT